MPYEPIQTPEPLSGEAKVPSKRKKRPSKKPPPKPEVAPNPTIAQSALTVAVLGESVNGYVDSAKGLADQNYRAPWGRHTWKDRRERERKRSKWISMLTPGYRIYREYKGRVWTVPARSDSYLLEQEGVAYPTLYAATKRIVGTVQGRNGRKLCPWSAVKFWNLKRLWVASPS